MFKILDCTVRDGGYLNNWHFDIKMVREIYRTLSKSGIDVVELGFLGTEKYFNRSEFGPWRFSDIENLKTVTEGIKGAKLALMGDYGKIDFEDFSDEILEYVDLIRIAAHKNRINDAVKMLEKIKRKGIAVSLQAMGITSYSSKEIFELIRMLHDTYIDYIYIADSYGSILPDQVKGIIDPFRDLPNTRIGFHPHNSLQMAFANALEAIKNGVEIIDCTICGMGRGAGNLPTEVILSYLQLSTKDKYNVIPVLNCIDRFFTKLDVTEPWGYQLPYMLSGIFKVHPYYPKTLVDYKEYTMEDIWKALEYVQAINPIGFSKEIIDRIIQHGLIGELKKGEETKNNHSQILKDTTQQKKVASIRSKKLVKYKNRYKGREFLILANGPTLREYKQKIEHFIKKNNPVVLGANYISGLFKPHYHAFNNKRRFIDYIETVDNDSNLLIGENIPKDVIREYTLRDYETIYFLDALNNFNIKDGVIQSNCRTISVLLMGVAIIMGAERIFAAGMDGYEGKGQGERLLFYDEKAEPEAHNLIMERHFWNQRFLEQIDDYLISLGKEGIHILTPTSHKSFYKGIENFL